MVKLANILSRLNPAKILVIGDMLLDSYTIGKARRISPEAPVAVLNVVREEHRPGGAGNVILNLLSLGAEVVAVGRVGNDWAGQTLSVALQRESVDVRMVVPQEGYFTPVKNRIIADNQQIVRIDHEQIIPLNESLEQYIIDQLDELLTGVKIIAISDYGKGFLTPTLLAVLIQKANQRGIPTITDPKGHDFKKYQGTTIIKPNLNEAYAAANLPGAASLENVAAHVLSHCQARLLMVTRSEAGISLFNKEGVRFDFPVHAKEVKDVTGAGDTVLAMFAHALANELSYEEGAQLCNVAAGIAIEHVGCARVSLSDLALRLFEHNISHKIFDEEHLFVLKEVLKLTTFSILMLSQIDSLTPALFLMIKELSKEKKSLLIYVDQIDPNEVFLDMLSSLQEVNFIVLHVESLKSLCHEANPSSIYAFDPSKEELIAMEYDQVINSLV